jgi:hypothetical protein
VSVPNIYGVSLADCDRGAGAGWRRALLNHEPSAPHVLAIETKLVDHVAFKLTEAGELAAFENRLDLARVEWVNEQGLWFSPGDDPGFYFWQHLIPWSQVVGFGLRGVS